ITRAGKCSPCRRCIAPHLSDYAFAPDPRKQNGFLVTPIDRQRSQGAKRSIEIALAQQSIKPKLGDVFGFARIFGNDRLDRRHQWTRVGMPMEFDLRAPSWERYVFWNERDRTVQGTLGIRVTAQTLIALGDLVEEGRVVWIK